MKNNANWLKQPGGLDALNLSPEYDVPVSSGPFGIPSVLDQWIAPPNASHGHQLIRYNERNKASKRDWLHFFINDRHFESVWNSPVNGLRTLSAYSGCIGPDFSCYVGWPFAANLWNVYRSRWLTRFWQGQGIKVIPVVSWSDASSFEYAFEGIPVECYSVAISVQGIEKDGKLFRQGLSMLLDRINPVFLLWYGQYKPKYEKWVSDSTRVVVVNPTRTHQRTSAKRD